MQALVWEAPRAMNMRQQSMPTPNAGEVVIKVAYAGICGSELSGYLGHNALRVPPLVMGHEFSGVVSDVGPDAGAWIQGALVTVNPLYCAGDSELRRRGLAQLCPTRRLIGAHVPGAYAEYVKVPVETLHALPDNVSLREGALTEPVGCGVRIGELAGDVRGQACLVIGMGPIGLLSLQVLKMQGAATVYVADLDEHRLEMGRRYGGVALQSEREDVVACVLDQTEQAGVAVSVDAVGTGVTRTQCVSATAATGKVILSGLHEEVSDIPAADVIRREITLRGSFSYSPANFKAALDLLARKAISLEPWIVEAPLAEGGQWFDRLVDAPGNVSKVLLVPEAA